MSICRQLNGELEDQFRLLSAEQGTLRLEVERLPVQTVLDAVGAVSRTLAVAGKKNFRVGEVDPEERIETDASLLVRVLTNMTKNALEAVGKGEMVSLSFERTDDLKQLFRVHNPGVIPAHIAPQIFMRSFSTKGQSGRGIGTYSMKLLGEKYLRGKVSFESRSDIGTVFQIELSRE